MTFDNWLPLLILLTSLIPGIVIFIIPEDKVGWRTTMNMGSATLKLALIGIMIWGVKHEHSYEIRIPILPDIDLMLKADALSVMMTTLSGLLWFLTTLYAIAYLESSPQSRSRFFGFFSLCVSSTIGIALAGNLFTFLLFYEMLTLSTYPLVVFRGTPESMHAGRTYIAYTIGGGTVFLIGVAWLYALVGSVDFTQGGMLSPYVDVYATQFRFIFLLMISGLGVKAALVPLHGWLPKAMVAPAPVSALLHAVAVVKAGAFGIVRVVYDVFGIELSQALGLLQILAVAAAFTIVYGSLRALFQDELKKRLAYSTVSQVSYIALGASVFGPVATIGGIVHLVHQGLMKITLFFCAGNFAETSGVHYISEMNGMGRRMPWTMAAFTLASLGMIGVPPIAGFISKWYLASGALAADKTWVIAILIASSLLNAAYFLPIIYRGWFQEPDNSDTIGGYSGMLETHWMLLFPPLVTALLSLMAGVLADSYFSPLEWARLITTREYGP